ncbi:uncharacterized protein LOC113321012 [Papaver somniferum]|uniref:uncharacterized protein LOC113321012 n=1 Tax=Papaver somniferum TaxID=3469 RepID=UPI000E7031FF|nr:uncharacterized protein LOC113321012 [Papaver somniferum]
MFKNVFVDRGWTASRLNHNIATLILHVICLHNIILLYLVNRMDPSGGQQSQDFQGCGFRRWSNWALQLGKQHVPISRTRRLEFQSIGLTGSFQKIVNTEGISGFYRGKGASVARIVPHAALHYMAYEQYRG